MYTITRSRDMLARACELIMSIASKARVLMLLLRSILQIPKRPYLYDIIYVFYGLCREFQTAFLSGDLLGGLRPNSLEHTAAR